MQYRRRHRLDGLVAGVRWKLVKIEGRFRQPEIVMFAHGKSPIGIELEVRQFRERVVVGRVVITPDCVGSNQ